MGIGNTVMGTISKQCPLVSRLGALWWSCLVSALCSENSLPVREEELWTLKIDKIAINALWLYWHYCNNLAALILYILVNGLHILWSFLTSRSSSPTKLVNKLYNSFFLLVVLIILPLVGAGIFLSELWTTYHNLSYIFNPIFFTFTVVVRLFSVGFSLSISVWIFNPSGALALAVFSFRDVSYGWR